MPQCLLSNNQYYHLSNYEDLYSEFCDRKNREINIIVTGLPEPNDNHSGRKAHDKEKLLHGLHKLSGANKCDTFG